VLGLLAIVLAVIAVRSTEVYTSRYQTLPVLDWLESRPPLAESANVAAATDLARGLSPLMPLLVIREDAHSQLPVFGPPSSIERTVSGVRDSARILLGTPGDYKPNQVPITARLDVIVFDRAETAASWSALMSRAMDLQDPESGIGSERVSGPDERDGVWVPAPDRGRPEGGTGTVVGYRGTVGFVLQVNFLHLIGADVQREVDQSARAEVMARQAAGDWSTWLSEQLNGA
jgi:hypothetical protein